MNKRIFAVIALLLLALPFTAAFAQEGTLVDVIAGSADHTVLAAAVEAAGLAETLAGGEFTVFAPTDAAFTAALEAIGITAEDLLANTELLTSVLTYHVVEGTVTSDMVAAGTVATVNGASLTVSVSDMGIMVDQANVTAVDLMASNGVVHVIDSVLLTLNVEAAAVTGDIAAAGSSTVFPLAERLLADFVAEGYAGSMIIDSIGSGAGLERFCVEGASDIANASRAIKDSEVEACAALATPRTPIEVRLGTDALAVVVSAENDFVTDATIAELALIFGSAANWSDVRAEWPAEPIQRFIPGTDSGTFDYFVEAVFEDDSAPILSVDPTTSEDDNVLVQGVQGSPYAIAFLGYAYYAENADTLKALSVEGIEPNAANVDAATYPLARPLFMYTDAGIVAEKPQVGSFLAYALSNVNDVVIEVGYFPAPAADLFAAKVAVLKLMLGM